MGSLQKLLFVSVLIHGARDATSETRMEVGYGVEVKGLLSIGRHVNVGRQGLLEFRDKTFFCNHANDDIVHLKLKMMMVAFFHDFFFSHSIYYLLGEKSLYCCEAHMGNKAIST